MKRFPPKGGDMNRAAARGKGTGTDRAGGRPGRARAVLAVGFAFGLAFGLALGAVAYFMNLKAVPSGILAYGIQLTGHPDIAEDLIWFFSGGFIGATFAVYAVWRLSRGRADGIEREHIFNRTFRVLEGGPAADPEEVSAPKKESEERDRS